MERPPLVSWLIPVRNGGPYLPFALESVIKASFQSTEIILVDDASYDGSGEWLEDWTRGRKNTTLIRLRSKVGVAGALNVGLRQTRGRYIARMDSDDITLPNRLELQVEFMERTVQCAVLGAQVQVIDSLGQHLGKKIFPTDHDTLSKYINRYIPVQHSAALFRGEWLRSLRYKATIRYAEDLDLYFRLCALGELRNLSEELLHYRVWGGSETFRDARHSLFTACSVRRKYVGRGALRQQLRLAALQCVSRTVPSALINEVYSYQRYQNHKNTI